MKKPGAQQTESGQAVAAATVSVWQDDTTSAADDVIAGEIPVALVYNGISHAVMMATPADLADFALGFSLTEQIVHAPEEVFDTVIESGEQGIEVNLTIAGARFAELKARRRSLTGRTGCGICGAESLEQTRLPLTPVTAAVQVSHGAIDRAVTALADHQPVQGRTGAVHGAAWCDLAGTILLLREDVGRHNALDKLIGRLAREGRAMTDGFLLISSRASYEMVQKAAMSGMAVMAAVSAPTSLALEVAQQAGITLVGFARPGRHVIYSNPQRLT